MNKKLCALILTAIYICILGSCNTAVTHGRTEPARTETREFNLSDAIEIVFLSDKVFADISKHDTVTREEFEEFLTKIKSEFPSCENYQWEYMFFYNDEADNEELETLHLNKAMFYPTIHHKGIEVASATITDTFYDDDYLSGTTLNIIEEYTGDDPKLANWYREYVFEKNDDGKWEIIWLEGHINLMEDGIDNRYLPFK